MNFPNGGVMQVQKSLSDKGFGSLNALQNNSIDFEKIPGAVAQNVNNQINSFASPEAKQQRENFLTAFFTKIVDAFYTKLDNPLEFEFSYKVSTHYTHIRGTLPSWAKSAPMCLLNGVRIYWLLYRDASWRHIVIGFCAGVAIAVVVPPALSKLQVKKIVDYDKIASPGLLHLIDFAIFIYTLVFSSRPAALALGWQMGKQVVNLLPRKSD